MGAKRFLSFLVLLFVLFSESKAVIQEPLTLNNGDNYFILAPESRANGDVYGIFNQPAYNNGEFTPFSNTPNGGPILYGPGGDPIGGLPVEDGVLPIFLMAVIWSLLRMYRIKLRTKS